MTLRNLLVACSLLLVAASQAASAQDESRTPQLRYIEEIKQRNADYGPGCDGIGVSVPPAVEVPDVNTSNWAAGHSACVPGMRLVMTCLGDVVGEERIIGCTLRVADGQAEASAECERFTLIVPEERLAPDPALSDVLSQGGAVRSCSDAGSYAAGDTIGFAFLVPVSDPAPDAAVLIDLDGSEVPAFIVPAGQLNRGPSTDP